MDPEYEALLADSVGLALLVVMETLTPAERLAFVLHDMFAVPFSAIAPIVGRSPEAARQLASRARRRVRGAAPEPEPYLARQREGVDAFLGAARGGDFEALLELLDPDVVLRVDGGELPRDASQEVRGADAGLGQLRSLAAGARFARPAIRQRRRRLRGRSPRPADRVDRVHDRAGIAGGCRAVVEQPGNQRMKAIPKEST